MAKVHVKKGDTVYVLCGKDRAATGKVLRVLPVTGRVVVEGVNTVSKQHKPRSQQSAAVSEHAAPIVLRTYGNLPQMQSPQQGEL